MALKLEVTFDVGVKIVGDADNYTPIKDQIVIVCEPFTSGTYNSETIPNFTQLANQPFVNDINTYNTTYIIQNTVFTNVFVFNPTHVEEVNGKLKCTVPQDMHEVIRFIKKYNYFYEHVDGGQELKRKDTPSEISNSTKKSSSIVKNPVVGDDDEDGEIETNDEFAFEIQSGSIDPTGAEITYNFTSTRDLTIYKEVNGNFVFNETGTISDLDLTTQDVSTLLNLTFSDHNLYYDTEASGATQNFALDSGIDIQQNDKKIVLQVNPAGGKLVQTSSATITALKGPTPGNIVATDQFKLFLEIAEDFTFTNNIKNPIIKARIDPSDAKDGYIVLDLYESSDANAPLIENLTPYSGNDDGTLRHGTDTDITQTDNTDHPVASSFSIYSTNSYTNLGNFDFKFKEAGEKNITDNEVANPHLIVEHSAAVDRDVIKLRLDRFPRHGVDYDIYYTHKLNKTSGIFNDDGNAVISDSTTPLDIANSLQEVTATVGKLKVHYPPSVPGNFAGNSPDFNEYSEYTAYYYVDITFQRAGTNGNVDITAKYNNNYEYQYESGHNIHHGLIIDSGAADGNINEDITRTRIGNINSATGDFTPVDLRSNSNQTGNVLRIEVPIAVTGAIASNRYPYELGNSPGLTKYNLTDSNNTPSIHLIDREELDEDDNSYTVPQYYYINVMDSLGNVVSPIQPENLIKDDDWGKDSDEKTPSVTSVEYKVRWDAEFGVWVKELVLTHNQDLQGAGVANSLALIDDESPAWVLPAVALGSGEFASVLTVSINDSANTLLTSEVAAGNITLAYTKPTEDPQNILTNWLGFEIEEYNGDDAKTVTLPTGNGNTNPAPPVVQSLSLSVGSINDTTDEAGTNPSFEIPLTWTISGSTNGITYDVEQSTDGGINWTNADTENANNIDTASTTGATVSGLSYNTAYTFRVKVTTYETSVPSTTTLSSQNGPAGELSNVSIFSNISGDDGYPKVVISWNKPDNATQYKIEWDTGVIFDQLSSHTEGDGLSGFNVGEETVSYTFEGENSLLNPNETYYFRPSYSTTSSPGGPYTFGPATQVVGPVTTFPEEIETITVENSNDDNTINYNALNVSWTKPADDDGDVDYEIQYDTSSQFNSANTVPITGDTHLIDGLDASTTYYIRVRSKNESPDNPPTSQYTAWVPSDIGTSKSTNAMPPAGAPTNFSLGLDNAANTHKIEAGWNKPNDETYIYEYKLEVSTDSSYGTNDIIATITSGFSEAEGLVSKTIDDSNIAGTFSGNTTYYLRASIRKSDDNGTSWGNYGATSGNNIVTVYDKITNYTAWGGDKASEEATPYGETTVYYYNDGTNSGPNQTIELPSTPHSIDWGDSTTPHSFANLDVKLEIADNSAFTSNLKVKYEGSSVLNKALNFQGMPDPETGAYYTTSGSGSSGITFFNTWIHTYTQDPNNQNTYYASLDHKTDAFNERKWFRIYVGNPDSWDTNGDPVFNTGNPGWGLYHEFDFLYLTGEPGTLSSGNITATGFDVTWGIETVTLPSAPSGITYEYTYKVTYSTSSEFTNGTTSEITAISHPTSGTTKTQTLQSLSGNTNYYIKVSSSNQYTTSSNVNYYEYGIANDNDGTATLTLPPQVAGLSSGTVTDTSLTLTWTAIGGEAFDTSETSNDGYTVEYSSDSGSTWNESDNHIDTTSHTVTGLTSGTTYQFRVYATNASGDGAASTSLSVTTPDTTPPTLSNFSWKFSSFPNLDSTPAFDIQSDEAGTISATYNNGDDDFTISPTTISANSLTTFTLSDSTGSALAVGTYNDVSFNVVDDAGNSASESVSDLVVASSGWSPIGSDINGEAAGDYSGWSVASSSDGTIVAIGANFNDDNGSNSGHVRVYQNISGTWTQLGADIDGEATGDKSGQSVSLSNDGSIVAIGATSNDGNGTNSGHVRVYEWDATANGGNGDWDQLGNDIDGEAYGDFSGFSVSLSSDGTKLAIGASSNDGNGTNSGHVRVYEWDATANGGNGDWDQLGSDINGEATDDYSGWSVSLSSDGSIVAIGAFGNNDGGSDSGHVRVYQYTSGEMLTGWNQLGADINGEATNDYSGYSVSLNSDGSIVAIGAYNNDGNGSSSGNVRVYENISGTWTQLGSDIDGEAVGDYSGRSVSLSNDGTIVAIGAKQNDGNGSNSGHVRVYEYSNSSWGQLGADIDGEAAGDQSGHSVSLSDDGTIVAIGAPFNDGSGHVRVYEFITTIPTMTITAANSSGTAIANGSTTNDSSIVLTFTSSEVTTDFSGNDIIVTNGTLGTLSGTETTYIVQFTPSAINGLACTIDVAESTFTDAAGNDNTAATQFEWTYDNTAPAPAPVSAPTGLVPATGLQVIIEFTEELFLGTDVAFSDLNSSIENTNKSGFAVNLSGQGSGGSSNQSIAKDDNDPKKIIISGPTIYIDPDSSNVTVEYTQPTTEAHRLRDAAGNFLANFNNSVITIDNDSEEVAPDNQAPNLSNISNPPTLGNNNKPQFSFTSDEAGTISVIGAHSSSISVSNTSTNDQAVANGSNTFELTNSTGGGLSDNTYTGVTVSIADSASNSSSITLTEFEIDTTAPTITSQSSAEWYYETEGEGEMSGETTWTMLTNAATFGPTNKIKCFVSVTELNGLSLKSGTDVVKIDGTTMGSADSVDCYAQPGGNIHYVEMIYTIPATDTPNANGDLTFEFTLKDDAGNELDLSSNNIGPGGNSSIPNTDAITIDTTRPNLSNFSWKFSSFPNLDTTPEFEIQSDEVGTISATYNNGTDAFTISPTTINANSLTTFTLSDSTGSALAVGTYNDVSFNVVDDAGNSASMSVSDLVVDSYDWSQLGSDIDGGAAGDNSGWSVALNSDGTKLAIGAPHNDGNGSSSGHVRVYENISGTWTQLGDDIDGDAAGDQSGHSLSLSDDGSIVAIGAPYNDGSYSDSGNVRVYEWDATANSNNGAWTQKGGDIDGDVTDDYSGRSVSLSSDGSIVAIGANLNDGNGESAGHVRVFLYSDTNDSWSQLGGDIDGEAAGDNSGWSVSLSSDGSIVAIGAIYNGGNGSNSGNVRVFLYSDTNDSWSQLGGDIDGEASGDYSGHSVSLSSDGSIVAIGANGNDGNGSASGHVRVYQYSNSSNNWSQLGDDIDGEAADDQSGHSLSLSDDGSIVAIGAPYNDGSYSDSGNVRVYEYISGTWTQLGADIDGEAAVDYSGRSVSLSSDGTKLAIGAPFNDGNGSNSGHVRVYEFITILPTMTITSNTVTSGSFSYDTEIDLTFTSSKKTNDFELSDITLNNTTDGTLSDFITVLKVTVQSVSGGDKYFINGIQQDSLVLESGNTYRFDQSDSTNSGRLIKFSITIDGTYGGGSEYTTEVTAVGTLGQSGSYTEIEITGSTPTTLYYYCSQHSGMGGSVSIASTNLTKTDEYVAKLTTTQNDAYTINVAANLFTDENLLMNLPAPQFAWTRVDQGWNQLGSDIDGEAAGDQSGRSVSLSSDGSIVAIGAPYNDGSYSDSGHVRVYENISGTWTQLGADIDGAAGGDYSGRSVSLSSDGTIVAIGANKNDDNGNNSGHVIVYQYSSSTTPNWTQLGADIDGEASYNYSGWSVSLSNDGSIVAIGAIYNAGGGNSNSGHVRVYENKIPTQNEWDNGNVIKGADAGNANPTGGTKYWVQLGTDIDGEASGDYSGWSVALSNDGTIVAIGANKNDDNGNNSGHVKVYQYSNNSWTPKGFDIDGEAADDESGIAVALSNDGSIVAIGANKNDAGNTNTTDDRGHVRVYKNKIPTQNEWDNGNVIKGDHANNANPTSGTKYWVQLGTDIDGEAVGDYSGYSVSLSSDGEIVAIGAIYNGETGSGSGHVRVYQYTSGSWTQKGDDMDGEATGDNSGRSVSLSSDGTIVAIGAPVNDAGNVRVYKWY